MPIFANPEDVVFWLRRQPRDVAVVFAARAALRVIPLIVREFRLGGNGRRSTLGAFRSVQVAWAVAAYPGEAARLRPAAQPAGLSVDHGNAYDPNNAYEVESAADWAAAAAGTVEDSRRFTPNASRYALKATLDGGPDAGDDLLKSMAADADLLDQRVSPVSLALSSTLWPGPSPDWAFNEWAELEKALLDANEDWEVWTDWYEARLKGGKADQVIEVARATIPTSVWHQGAKVVNGQIRALYEERGIWRHARTGVAEAPVKRDGIEQRLAALSIQQIAVVGVRAALRALPLMSFGSPAEPTFSAALLIMLRITSLTWAAVAYPTQTPNLVPLNAARVDAINSRVGLVRAVAAAAAGYSPNQFEKIIEEVVLGIRALRAAAAQSHGEANAAAFDLALSQDMDDLSGAPAGAAALAKLELWPGRVPPEWMARRWDTLKQDLLQAGLGWELWVDWYEHRLAGRTRTDGHELAYVEVPDDLWKEPDPARVNTWIMKRFEQLPDHALDDLAVVDTGLPAPPAIPAQQPAAIEPVWSKGRLTLPKAAAKSDLKGRSLTAALKSLREEMRAFADDITGEANIDKRFVSHVQRVADQIPQKAPRQVELFGLGHAEVAFAAYAETVNAEWPPALAARYHALVIHFDRTMRQSPLWREFRRNAAKQTLTPPRVEAAASLAVAAASALRDEEAKEFVDPAIPAALEELSAPLQSGLPKDFIEAGKEELAYDVIESLNNILKLIATAALWGWQAGKPGATWISDTAKQGKTEFLSEARKSVVNEFEQAGKAVGPGVRKLLSRALKFGGAYAGGKPLLVWLVANYPSIFGWLEPVVNFLSHHVT